ncbi:MAG: BrnA antitoxin family protein [Longimicrobiaceae bacterium]
MAVAGEERWVEFETAEGKQRVGRAARRRLGALYPAVLRGARACIRSRRALRMGSRQGGKQPGPLARPRYRSADLGAESNPHRTHPVRQRRTMRNQYDFSGGKRGAVDPAPAGKTRITIRLDADVLTWFRSQVESAGGGNYQSLINAALREHVGQQRETLEETLRRVVREELHRTV